MQKCLRQLVQLAGKAGQNGACVHGLLQHELLNVLRSHLLGHRAAAAHAKNAYDLVLEGAAEAGVPVTGSTAGWAVDEPTRPGKPHIKGYAAVDRLAGTHRARP